MFLTFPKKGSTLQFLGICGQQNVMKKPTYASMYNSMYRQYRKNVPPFVYVSDLLKKISKRPRGFSIRSIVNVNNLMKQNIYITAKQNAPASTAVPDNEMHKLLGNARRSINLMVSHAVLVIQRYALRYIWRPGGALFMGTIACIDTLID
jgi:hypothetical protein